MSTTVCWNGFCIAGDCDGTNHVDATGDTWEEAKGSEWNDVTAEWVLPPKLVSLRRRIEILTGDAPEELNLPATEKLYADEYQHHRETFGPFDKDATDTVSEWIQNDEPYYDDAKRIVDAEGLDAFMRSLSATLDNAAEESTAWYARRSLSRREMDCVEWFEVACVLFDV